MRSIARSAMIGSCNNSDQVVVEHDLHEKNKLFILRLVGCCTRAKKSRNDAMAVGKGFIYNSAESQVYDSFIIFSFFSILRDLHW
jgi:hypothetical protein